MDWGYVTLHVTSPQKKQKNKKHFSSELKLCVLRGQKCSLGGIKVIFVGGANPASKVLLYQQPRSQATFSSTAKRRQNDTDIGRLSVIGPFQKPINSPEVFCVYLNLRVISTINVAGNYGKTCNVHV